MEMKNDRAATTIPTEKIVLYVSIVTMIMLFGAFTSGYIVRQAEGRWVYFTLPTMFWFSTAVMLLSSFTMNRALMNAKVNDQKGSSRMLVTTLALGLGFCVMQFLGWSDLITRGIHFTGSNQNASGSWMYILTFFHFLHLVGGLIALVVTITKSFKGRYSAANYLGISLCGIYWHFLDLLWVYLFIFLLLFR